MSIEALKQALEALEIGWSPKYVNGVDAREKGMKAITSLRQAIADLEKQEPYGWVSQHTTKGMYEWQFNKELSGVYKDTAISILPVYIHPQPIQPLTDEQIDNIEFAGLATPKEKREFARAIEAAHGIKEHT